MAPSPLVNRNTAMQKPTKHQHLRGLGYLAHDGPPALPSGANGNKNCKPPSGTADGTRHILQPPGGHKRMELIWMAAHSAWSHPTGKGNRLAWTCDHLSRAGWEYIGPAEAEPIKSKIKRNLTRTDAA